MMAGDKTFIKVTHKMVYDEVKESRIHMTKELTKLREQMIKMNGSVANNKENIEQHSDSDDRRFNRLWGVIISLSGGFFGALLYIYSKF